MKTTEVEMCLSVAPQEVAALRQFIHTTWPTAPQPLEQNLVSIYYDSAEGHLAQQRAGLRLRYTGSQWLQTMKYGQQEQAGLVTRVEIEHVVAGEALELHHITQPQAQAMLAKAQPLVPTFETRITRTLWHIQHQGSALELALDVGYVGCQHLRDPIHELEIELKTGQPESVHAVAAMLQAAFTMPLQLRSKAERGYALVHQLQG